MRTSILFIAAMAFVSTVYSQKPTGFDYPIKPGSAEWRAMTNTLDKVKVCQIPEAILKSMPTEELLDVCLKYPLLYSYIYVDSPYEGLQITVGMFNGLQEFVNREDAFKVWYTKYSQMNPKDVEKPLNLADKGLFTIDHSALELLVTNENLVARMTTEDENLLLRELLRQNALKNEHGEYFGMFGDVTTAFVGNKILESLEEKGIVAKVVEEKSNELESIRNAELKELFKKRMLVGSDDVVHQILDRIKKYVNELK